MKPQIFLLTVAVVLAGCVGQPGGTAGGGTAGLILTSFSPEVPEVESGQSVSFTTIVKNVGDITVTSGNAKIDIIGLDDWTGDKTKTVDIDLRRADPSRQEEGGEFLHDFPLTAPTGKQVTLSYTPTARLSYFYETISTIQMKFVTRELTRTNPNEQSTATVTTTSGPFLVTVKGKLPIIQSGDNVKVSFQLEIQNVGGGKAFAGIGLEAASNEADLISITVPQIQGVTIPACTPISTTNQSPPRLIGGKSRLLSCTLTFSKVPAAGFATSNFDLNLAYNYLIDTQSSVTVLKPI